jgi:cyanophycin synthetase
VAESIAQDKDLTKQAAARRRRAGAAGPPGRPTPTTAWAAAQEIGLPVVVKPQDGNQGKGVTVNIVTANTEGGLRAAAETAR